MRNKPAISRAWTKHYVIQVIVTLTLAVAIYLYSGMNVLVGICLFFAATGIAGALLESAVLPSRFAAAHKTVDKSPRARTISVTPTGFALVEFEDDGERFYERSIETGNGSIKVVLADDETRFKASEPHALSLLNNWDEVHGTLVQFLSEQSNLPRFKSGAEVIGGLRVTEIQFFSKKDPSYAEFIMKSGEDLPLWICGYSSGKFERLGVEG